jgi:uncharacterized membrane protein
MSGWRFAAAAAALAGYALLSHWLMVHAAQAPWAVAALFGPLLLAVASTGWQRRQALTLAGCAALVLLLAAIVAAGGVQDMHRMYVLQHGGIHLALAWGFGITLRPGATPLITAMAERLHRRFSPEMRDYTRWLTRLWVRYFISMVAVSVAIYALAPWSWWSLYCNLFTPLAAVALFVGEHLVRYRRHPDFERVSLRAAFEAYRQAGPP